MRGLALIAALVLATPLAAQDRMTQTQCTQSLAVLSTLGNVPPAEDQVVVDDAGWCEINDTELRTDEQTVFTMQSVRWRASDVGRFIDEGLPPRSLQVEARGLGIAPVTGDAVFDYLYGLQSVQFNSGIGFTVRWDGLQNVVLIEDAYVQFSPDNRIQARARIDGVNLTDLDAIEASLATAGLSELTLTIDFAGWFESFVALPLGTNLLRSDGAPPAQQVATLKLQAIEVVAQIPNAIMPEQSRIALTAFVNSLPQPRGTARIQLSATPSLGAVRAAPFMIMGAEPSLEQIVELGLNGVSLLVTWTPKSAPQ